MRKVLVQSLTTTTPTTSVRCRNDQALPGIDKLKYQPEINNEEVRF